MIVVEAYALQVIGLLPEDGQAGMTKIVQRTWGGNDWMATVRSQLAWDTNIDDVIRYNWRRYQAAAREQGVPAGEREFAMIFADEMADSRPVRWLVATPSKKSLLRASPTSAAPI